MIYFFRRLRQKKLSDNNIRKYLFYAAGEIILVMLGILLALQVNNWNEQKKLRNFEKEILIQLKKELLADKKMMEENKLYFQQGFERCERIIYYLKNENSYPDSILSDFSVLSRGLTFSPNNSSLKTLEAKGIDLIKDPDLRNLIIELYYSAYKQIEGIHKNYVANLDSFFRPLLRTRFRYDENVNKTRKITPIDFKALKEDIEFLNAIMVAKSNTTAIVERYDISIEDMNNLIILIESTFK